MRLRMQQAERSVTLQNSESVHLVSCDGSRPYRGQLGCSEFVY